ncbi:MAG: stalk domain-containing protein [Defluviitaleaceae bacterium]|nr:stalk domain-containing protein [Defluviitaleaceae bacterium]
MTKNIKRRIGAVLLALFMVVPVLPAYVVAADIVPANVNWSPTIVRSGIFGNFLEARTGVPHAQVDLYVDGSFFRAEQADASGIAWFDLTNFGWQLQHTLQARAWNGSTRSQPSNHLTWFTASGGHGWLAVPTNVRVESANTLMWNHVAQADYYTISISDSSGTLTGNWHVNNDNQLHLGNPTPGTHFTFHVSAHSNAGAFSGTATHHWTAPGGTTGGGNPPSGHLPTPHISINSNGILTWQGGVAHRVRVYTDGLFLHESGTEVTSVNLHHVGIFPGSQMITIRHLHPTNQNLNSSLSNAVNFGGTPGWNQVQTPHITINHNTGVMTWGGGMRWVRIYVNNEPFVELSGLRTSVNLRDTDIIQLPAGTNPIRIRFLHDTNADLNSQLSNTINFNTAGAAVATPTISINQNTGRLTWSGGGNRLVRVYANDNAVWTSSGNVNHVDLLSIGLPDGNQPIRVRHLHATNTALHSGLSNTINFNAGGRPLATPSISINNTTGILTWTGGTARITAVYSGGNRVWTSTNNVTQVNLNGIGLNTGSHSIRIRHLHETNNSLHSNLSNTVNFNVTTPPALDTPVISVDGNGVLTWTGGGSRLVRLYTSGTPVWASPAPVSQVDLTAINLQPGTHNIQIRHLHDNANLNSGLSNTVSFTTGQQTGITNPRDTTNTHNAIAGALAQIGFWETEVVIPLPTNAGGVRLSQATMGLAQVEGIFLTFEQGDLRVTLSPTLMAEVRSWNSGDIDFNFSHHSSGLGGFSLGIQSGSGSLTVLQNPITVSAYVTPTGVANFNRIVAAGPHGNYVGGSFNQNSGRFVLNTHGTGAFNILNVDNLNRLRVSMDSFQIVDLAGNSQTQNMDVLPVIQDGRTLMPVRFMAYALGADIGFTDATENWPLTVHLTLDGRNVEMPVGMLSNQLQALGMDVPAQIINDRTMVPLRFISEFFGAYVSWDEATRSIEIIR